MLRQFLDQWTKKSLTKTRAFVLLSPKRDHIFRDSWNPTKVTFRITFLQP